MTVELRIAMIGLAAFAATGVLALLSGTVPVELKPPMRRIRRPLIAPSYHRSKR